MKINIVIFLLFFSIISTQLLAANNDVLYYYNSCPKNINYKIIKVDGSWKIKRHQPWPGYIENVIVDYKNGFIEYVEEFGDGSDINSFVIYNDLKNDYIMIGMSSFYDPGSCSINFYKVKNNNWELVTNKVLPKISLDLFFGSNYKNNNWIILENFEKSYINNPNFKLESAFPIIYHLPRNGTDIKADISFSLFSAYLGESRLPFKEKKALMYYKNRVKSIILYWDNKNEIFTIKH